MEPFCLSFWVNQVQCELISWDLLTSLEAASLNTAELLRAEVMARTPLKLLYSCSTVMISSERTITATLSSMLSVPTIVFSRYRVNCG